MALDQPATASLAQMAVSGAEPFHYWRPGEARRSAAAIRHLHRPGADRHDLSTEVDLRPGSAAGIDPVAALEPRCTQPA